MMASYFEIWVEQKIQEDIRKLNSYWKVRESRQRNKEVVLLIDLAAQVLRSKLYEKALRTYFLYLITTENPSDTVIDELYWEHEKFLYKSLACIKTIAGDLYKNFVLKLDQGVYDRSLGFTFAIRQWPILSNHDELKFTEQSLVKWKHSYRLVRQKYQWPEKQPFTLCFLALEAIKRQLYIVTCVKMLQARKYRYLDYNYKRFHYIHDSRVILNKSLKDIHKKALGIIRTYILK